MDAVRVIEDTIKNHPLIDFDNGPGIVTERWACCPCGFTTPRFKTAKAAAKAFEAHVAEEVTEELVEAGILTLESSSVNNKARRVALPTSPR